MYQHVGNNLSDSNLWIHGNRRTQCLSYLLIGRQLTIDPFYHRLETNSIAGIKGLLTNYVKFAFSFIYNDSYHLPSQIIKIRQMLGKQQGTEFCDAISHFILRHNLLWQAIRPHLGLRIGKTPSWDIQAAKAILGKGELCAQMRRLVKHYYLLNFPTLFNDHRLHRCHRLITYYSRFAAILKGCE